MTKKIESETALIADIIDEAFDNGIDGYIDMKFFAEDMEAEDPEIEPQDVYQTPEHIREKATALTTAIYDCVLTPIIDHYRKTGQLPEVKILTEN